MYDARSWYRCSGRGLGRMESCSRGRYVSGVFLLSLDILIKIFFFQALLPPSTFLQVIPLLPQHTSPQIQMRKFKSGLSVLHTPSFAQSAFSTRLKAHLTLQEREDRYKHAHDVESTRNRQYPLASQQTQTTDSSSVPR